MGWPMAAALVEANFSVTVWNRTIATGERFCAEFPGATLAPSPEAVARSASTVVTMLPDLPQVVGVLERPDGLRAGWAPSSQATAGSQPDPAEPPLLVVMGTVSPVAVAEWATQLRALGIHLVDAPVSGGTTGAQERRLSIMAGGEAADVARCMPLFEAMGTTIKHLGPAGAGELAKACNQAVVAGTLTAIGEALNLARAGGLSSQTSSTSCRAASPVRRCSPRSANATRPAIFQAAAPPATSSRIWTSCSQPAVSTASRNRSRP